MNRQRQRTRRNTVTRTYPIYSISPSELSDDDSIIEIQPIRRHRRHRKKRFRVKLQESSNQEVLTDNHKPPLSQVTSERIQKTATIQTEETSAISSATENENSSKKKSSICCNHRCLRIFTLILAIFFLIISILLLAFSLNLLLNPNMTKIESVAIVYPNALPTSGFSGDGPTNTLLVTAIIGITVGGIMFFISILTIISLICIKFRYYGCFYCFIPLLLIILFLILIGFALFIIIAGGTELQRLAWSTQMTVYYYYNSTNTSLVRDGWDFVQYYFDCCGVITNNTDWYPAPSTGWQYNSQLPRSCCGSDTNDIGHPGRIFVGADVPTLVGFCYYGDIGKSTCYDSIKTNLFITVLVFLFGVAFIVLIIAILSIILICAYRKIHHRVENSIKK